MRKMIAFSAYIVTATAGETLDAAEQVPVFIQNFYADGDPGQCNGASYGKTFTNMGDWTPTIRMDTDRRGGGCLQQFAIYDPSGMLDGLTLQVDFFPDGTGQCDNPGRKDIPIHRGLSEAIGQMSDAYRIDTDNRPGGCQQSFILSGRADIALDVSFYADGDAGQCGNQGTHTATVGQPVTLRLDMDNRSGGCRQSLRLRRL